MSVNAILPGVLYQGANGTKLGVILHIHCAAEERPDAQGAWKTIWVKLDDSEVDWLKQPYFRLTQDALAAATLAAQVIEEGGDVLTTCALGLNRSGLLSTLILMQLGSSAEDAIDIVRTGRPGSMFNKSFCRLAKSLER